MHRQTIAISLTSGLVGGLIGVVVGTSIMGCSAQRATTTSKASSAADEITVKGINLVDNEGRLRATLDCRDKGEPNLVFYKIPSDPKYKMKKPDLDNTVPPLIVGLSQNLHTVMHAGQLRKDGGDPEIRMFSDEFGVTVDANSLGSNVSVNERLLKSVVDTNSAAMKVDHTGANISKKSR